MNPVAIKLLDAAGPILFQEVIQPLIVSLMAKLPVAYKISKSPLPYITWASAMGPNRTMAQILKETQGLPVEEPVSVVVAQDILNAAATGVVPEHFSEGERKAVEFLRS
jgi:hypothetical protein